MRIALLQLNPTVGALDDNCEAILRATRRAHELGAELAITSELCLPGYPPRDLLERPAFVRAVLERDEAIVRELPPDIALVFGTIDEQLAPEGRPLYNTALIARRGVVLGRAHKQLLPTYDVFDEDRYFEPGERACRIELNSSSLGITICEDAWNDRPMLAHRTHGGSSYERGGSITTRYHANPVRDAVTPKVDLLINVSASPFTLSKRGARPAMFPRSLGNTACHWPSSIRWGPTMSSFSTGAAVSLVPTGACSLVPRLLPKIWWWPTSDGGPRRRRFGF